MAASLKLPNLSDHLILVTGANSGIGFEAAAAFADAGARVLLGCRSAVKAEQAMAAIRVRSPQSQIEHLPLDLASLKSVRAAAEHVCSAHPRLDVLCNNAGVMAVPRALTEDGFELQLGVNHFGHFALTGLLLRPLLAAKAARIVTVSSQAHRIGKMSFEDLDGHKRYQKWEAYGQSKLANLLFAFELQRRLAQSKARALSVACHPGYASTNLQLVGPELEQSAMKAGFFRAANALFAQSAAGGALPTLRAATDSHARGGECFGPGGPFQLFGAPQRVEVRKLAHSPEVARKLWEVSVERTGVGYELLNASAVAPQAFGSHG